MNDDRLQEFIAIYEAMPDGHAAKLYWTMRAVLALKPVRRVPLIGWTVYMWAVNALLRFWVFSCRLT